jgi:hypothetical protein
VCFELAAEILFNCGLTAFIAGEVGNKKLLLLVSLEAVLSAVRSVFSTFVIFPHRLSKGKKSSF